jgi:predicted GNAT family N-acyltransferase
MKILVNKASSPEDIKKCLDIRMAVFVDGQKVSLDEELDGKDDASEHYLLLVDNKPLGTARVRFVDNYAKIERVAIIDAHQGKGFGKIIMQKVLSELRNYTSYKIAKISSQTHAISFYEKLGFYVCSGEYLDAGILHKDMQFDF